MGKLNRALKFLLFQEDNPKHRVFEAHAWQGVFIGLFCWVATGLFFKYALPIYCQLPYPLGVLGFIVSPAFISVAFAMFLHCLQALCER